jgi:hypothetical protein
MEFFGTSQVLNVEKEAWSAESAMVGNGPQLEACCGLMQIEDVGGAAEVTASAVPTGGLHTSLWCSERMMWGRRREETGKLEDIVKGV